MKVRLKKAIHHLHNCLIMNYNDFECKIKEHLNEDIKRRPNIHDYYRRALEIRIDNWNIMIKSSKKIELELREIFNYIDYDIDNKFTRISELEKENKELKERIEELEK